MTPRDPEALSTLDYHVLLALAEGPRYGYAIKDAIESESDGTLRPRAGTLYRVIARLMAGGMVREAKPGAPAEPHPGRARRYYGLSARGRAALAAEARRLKGAAALAEGRLRLPQGSR